MPPILGQLLPKGILKAIVASSIGNVIEWIDFGTYGLAAPFIAAQFFSPNDPATATLKTFGLFAVGFLMRPIGALVIGPYGDKHGRNKALALTILLMAGGTGAIGVLPTYASIGVLAPLLLTFFRLLQGFALGGEWGAAVSYLYELAPANRRCFISSFRTSGTGLGFFAASAVLALMTMITSAEGMKSWGWRVPFLFALVTGIIAFYIRLRLEDSPIFLRAKAQHKTSKQPLTDMVKYDKKGMAIVFGISMVGNSVFYVLFTAWPNYLTEALRIPYSVSMKMTMAATLFYTIMVLAGGLLADIYNKKKLLEIVCVGYLLLSYPAFLVMQTKSYIIIVGVFLLFSLLLAVLNGTAVVVLAEQFPTRTRNTSLSIASTLQTSLFAGTAPLCVAWLTSVLHNPMAPAYYMIAAAIPSYIAVRYATYTGMEDQPTHEPKLAGTATR